MNWPLTCLFLLGCWSSHWHAGGIVYFWPSQDELLVKPEGLNNPYPLIGWLPWNSSRHWKVPCGSGHRWRSGIPAKSWRLCQNPPLRLRAAGHVSGCLRQPGCFWCEESGMGVRRKQGTNSKMYDLTKKHEFYFLRGNLKIKSLWYIFKRCVQAVYIDIFSQPG